MFQRYFLAGVVVSAALVSIDCGSDDSKTGDLEIVVSVVPATMLADGVSSAVVSVDAGGYSGPMQITTTQGYLSPGLEPDGGTLSTINLTAVNGKATATLRSCNYQEPGPRPCGGGVRVTASADASEGLGFATFSCNGPCPTNEGGSGGGGGGGEGGSGGEMGGSGGGGSGGTGSGGSGGISGTYTVKLASSRSIVRNLFEVTTITATVQKDGRDLSGEMGTVHFTYEYSGEAYLGLARPPSSAEVDAPLDRNKAVAYFTGLGVDTSARITATYKNGTGTVDVRLDPGGDLAKILTVKNSNPVVGVRGSINERSSEIIFALTDQADVPMPPGIPVTFTLTSTSNDSLEPYEAVTDDDGKVRTVFTPGGFPGSAGVRATAKNRAGGDVQTTATVSVKNGVPSQRDIALVCDSNQRFLTWGCIGDKVSCSMFINDRSNADAAQGLEVFFFAETGQIDASAKTDLGGTVKIEFLSKDDPTALDEAMNPKSQGIVTIMGYTRGEEQFEDCNANGFYDRSGGGGPVGSVCPSCDDWRSATCDAEPFTDISEPFVDDDGNGRQNGNEKFVNGNQAMNTQNWDGPNGVWDGDTNVWTAFNTLWINTFEGLTFQFENGPSPGCSEVFTLRAEDGIGNCVNPDNNGDITLKINTSGVQGTFSWAGSKAKIGGCYDLSSDAQLYPFSVQITSKPPPDVETWPIQLQASLNYTQSCDTRQAVLTTITCDGLR